MTYLGTAQVDIQTVSSAAGLKANDYVAFHPEFALEATAGMSLTGGVNGEVDGSSYQEYLDKAESYTFNTMGVVTVDDTTKRLIENYSDSDVTVEQGDSKKSVIVNGSITVVNAMSQLYMTITVA